jgi:tryptophan synthase alpha chain
VFMLAPTSSRERIALVAQQASGFIYVVSLTGTTGERAQLPPDVSDFITRVRAQTGDTPLVLGFGISQPQHVEMIRDTVDGFAVGTAFVRAGGEGMDAVLALAQRLQSAMV